MTTPLREPQHPVTCDVCRQGGTPKREGLCGIIINLTPSLHMSAPKDSVSLETPAPFDNILNGSIKIHIQF